MDFSILEIQLSVLVCDKKIAIYINMIDEKQFIQNFADQFDDEPEGLTLETKFRDIDGWTSIIALSEMAMCDEEYDVILSANEMENANCIADIYTIVNERYQG